VIASISYGNTVFILLSIIIHRPLATLVPGSEAALISLLRAHALHAFLLALSNLRPNDTPQLKSALARGLRVLSTAVAEVVGPSQLGLRTWSPDLRSEAKDALSYLFEVIRVLFLMKA